MRLIDAYSLQDEIQRSKMDNPHKDAKVAENHVFEHEHFIKMVVLQPTAQEEIVRCEHCWKRNFDNCPFNEYSLVVPEDDFFCGAGEREMKNEE